MTPIQRLHTAQALVMSRVLVGEGMYMPKAFVVNGKPYWFLNVARRAAYDTQHPIEVMTFEEACEIMRKYTSVPLDPKKAAVDFDQTGSNFEGQLFCDNPKVYADSVNIRIIKTA